ncbi:hypothetical protein Hanom_Chr02g00170901 [Helianthus anomalus]
MIKTQIFVVLVIIVMGIPWLERKNHFANAQQNNPASSDPLTKSIFTQFNAMALLFHQDDVNDLSFCMKNM